MIGTAVPASPTAGNGRRKRQVTKGPISAGRHCGASSEAMRGQPGRGAGRVDLPRSATRFSAVFGSREAKRDARVVDPRRAAERRMVLTEDFGSPDRPDRLKDFAILRV